MGLDAISAEMDEYEARKAALESDLVEVEMGLKASYRAALSDHLVQEVCRKLAGILECDASREDWQGLFQDYGVRVFINQGGKHTLQASLAMEPPESIVEHQSRRLDA